jgi:phosphatidylglycerophosphate synthase
MALGGLLVLVLLHSELLYGCLVFLVGFFDGVDGAVARAGLRTSSYGALADSAVDKLAEIVLLLGIGLAFQTAVLLGLSVPLWVGVCISSWLFTSYLRSRAETLGATDLDVGLGGRSERLFILSILSTIGMTLYGLFAVTILGIATASYRFHVYGKQTRNSAR